MFSPCYRRVFATAVVLWLGNVTNTAAMEPAQPLDESAGLWSFWADDWDEIGQFYWLLWLLYSGFHRCWWSNIGMMRLNMTCRNEQLWWFKDHLSCRTLMGWKWLTQKSDEVLLKETKKWPNLSSRVFWAIPFWDLVINWFCSGWFTNFPPIFLWYPRYRMHPIAWTHPFAKGIGSPLLLK